MDAISCCLSLSSSQYSFTLHNKKIANLNTFDLAFHSNPKISTPLSRLLGKGNERIIQFPFCISRKKKNFQFNFSVRAMTSSAEAVHTDVKIHSSLKKDLSPVIVIDNYDSFTYNLCQYLGDLGCNYKVYRNDDITVEELEKMNPRGILISPGPGKPEDSGISLQTIVQLGPKFPLFGVCMGLQCMGQAFGGEIVRAPGGVMHGKKSSVYHNQENDGLLSGLPNPFTACRYHSLVINSETFPSEELEITAWTEDGLIMGVRHKKYRHIQGVQFHPESIITENGIQIVDNFIKDLEKFEENKSK